MQFLTSGFPPILSRTCLWPIGRLVGQLLRVAVGQFKHHRQWGTEKQPLVSQAPYRAAQQRL